MTVTDAAIQLFLNGHPNWEYRAHALHTTQTFATFRDAIDALVAIADEAERVNHHPGLVNEYTTLRIELTSHDVGAVTERDLTLADAIERIVRG